jgi:hypothetical protein
MITKLTLRMDEELIASAKAYSEKTGKSISRIVSDLFEMIKNEKFKEDYPLSPIVRSLKGVMKNNQIDEQDYKDYLEKKFL